MTDKKPKALPASLRRRARECATQFLFGLEFTRYPWEETLEDFWAITESKPSVRQYADELIRGVMEHKDELDARVAAALDNWAPSRMGHIERNIIRIALYEIQYRPDVPRKTAINEAIEIAKRYGADEAPRFVNGVLDAITKE